mmetsp:Transcript_36804/g.81866  ORF Transcript_36804/g.81866 Transcript_36804/m.81866 type:complete len:214 (+) Transcript_36804:1961-2602(+)
MVARASTCVCRLALDSAERGGEGDRKASGLAASCPSPWAAGAVLPADRSNAGLTLCHMPLTALVPPAASWPESGAVSGAGVPCSSSLLTPSLAGLLAPLPCFRSGEFWAAGPGVVEVGSARGLRVMLGRGLAYRDTAGVVRLDAGLEAELSTLGKLSRTGPRVGPSACEDACWCRAAPPREAMPPPRETTLPPCECRPSFTRPRAPVEPVAPS